MSNLLNNKKKLLNRGPKIVPAEEFVLEEAKPAKKAKRTTPADITSVRVTKATRNKINALIQMNKADNADLLIDILLEEYMENTLTADEKKTFDIVLDIIKKRD